MNQRTTQTLLVVIIILLAADLLCNKSITPTANAETEAVIEEVPAVLRAQEIQLVNKQGKAVVHLFLGEGGGGNIRLRSGDGTIRAKFGATDAGSGLILFDKETEPAVLMATNQDGTRVTLAEKGKEKKVITP
jgi:hypothetical protein